MVTKLSTSVEFPRSCQSSDASCVDQCTINVLHQWQANCLFKIYFALHVRSHAILNMERNYNTTCVIFCSITSFFQPKVVALGNTAIPVVTTPIAPNTSKTNTGARPSLLQPKFITTNIKNGAQPIQSAGPGSITLIQVCLNLLYESRYREPKISCPAQFPGSVVTNLLRMLKQNLADYFLTSPNMI